jgi:putative addiction module component (TIGR02574 family)
VNTGMDIVDAARQLAPHERLWLIDQLWNTLPPEQWPTLPLEEIKEVQRRSAAFDAGEESASSWEEVRSRLPGRTKSDG